MLGLILGIEIGLRLHGDILEFFLDIRCDFFRVTSYANTALYRRTSGWAKQRSKKGERHPRRCSPKIRALPAGHDSTALWFRLRRPARSRISFTLFVAQVRFSSSVSESTRRFGTDAGRSVAWAKALKTKSITC